MSKRTRAASAPGSEGATSRRRIAWVRGLVLLAVAYIGLDAPYRHLKAAKAPFTFDVASKADALYAATLPLVRPGERLGVFLLNRNDVADMTQWYSAQYALVPAVVLPLYVEDCLKSDPGPRCRMAEADRFVTYRDPRLVEAIRGRFGLAPQSYAGDVVVLARASR